MVESHLVQYEQALLEAPALRDHISSMARKLWRYSQQLPGPMPVNVAATFERIGAGTA